MARQSLRTADLCDRHFEKLRIVDLTLTNFGGETSAYGRASLVQLEDDNRILFDVLAQNGAGKVLVVQVKGLARPAVVGEGVVSLAVRHGWNGIIVDGAVRDVRYLAAAPLCVVAREVRPFRVRSDRRGCVVDRLILGGVQITADENVLVDEDGIIVFDQDLAADS
jgi:regulator of ribonuclease activity A